MIHCLKSTFIAPTLARASMIMARGLLTLTEKYAPKDGFVEFCGKMLWICRVLQQQQNGFLRT